MMSRLVRIAHLPLVLAAVFLPFGSVVPDRGAAADESKGAECAALDDPAARLACFDAAFPRPPRSSSAEPGAVAVAADEPLSEARAVAPAAADDPVTEVRDAAPAAAGDPVSEARSAAPVAAIEPKSEAQKFGLSSSQKAALETKPTEPAVDAMTATVKTVRRLPPGYLLIDLDNAQVWQQTEIDPLVRLQPGDRVTIRRASLGSHLLVTPAQYSTRVRRIR